jgi:hypothetical protein
MLFSRGVRRWDPWQPCWTELLRPTPWGPALGSAPRRQHGTSTSCPQPRASSWHGSSSSSSSSGLHRVQQGRVQLPACSPTRGAPRGSSSPRRDGTATRSISAVAVAVFRRSLALSQPQPRPRDGGACPPPAQPATLPSREAPNRSQGLSRRRKLRPCLYPARSDLASTPSSEPVRVPRGLWTRGARTLAQPAAPQLRGPLAVRRSSSS